VRAAITVQWDPDWRRAYGVPPGYLLVKVDGRYHKMLGKFCLKLSERQENRRAARAARGETEGDDLIDLDCTLEVHYGRRNKEQNALMWSLYTVIANEMNGDLPGPLQQMVMPEELYDADMKTIAPTLIIEVATTDVEMVSREWVVRRVETIPDTGRSMVTIVRTSSNWNTVEMAKHIEGLFMRIAFMGVALASGADVARYFLQWREHIAEQQIELYGPRMTELDYREATPWCEACGEFIAIEGGSLDHISTRGSGLTWGGEKKLASDWLHLCDPCHMKFRHQRGILSFAKVYKHLAPKIMAALKRGGEGVTDASKGTVGAAEAVQGVEQRDGEAEPGVGIQAGGSPLPDGHPGGSDPPDQDSAGGSG
jgi:hypothetical protein